MPSVKRKRQTTTKSKNKNANNTKKIKEGNYQANFPEDIQDMQIEVNRKWIMHEENFP